MEYELFVDYTTGDSFGYEEINGESMGVCFENRDVAKKALDFVKEHYDFYKRYDLAYYSSSAYARNHPEILTKEQLGDLAKTKEWYYDYETKGSPGCWSFCIKLPVDNEGGTAVVGVPYTGYFETLRKAYVKKIEDEGLCVNF